MANQVGLKGWTRNKSWLTGFGILQIGRRRSSWAVRVGSGPGFQLVDGGWSGLTGLQLTGVVSGRVVGGSGPARPQLTIDVTIAPPPTTR